MKKVLDKSITSPEELEQESKTYLSLSPGAQTFADLIYAQEMYFKKLIVDTLNKYKSWLREAKYSKLTKTISETEIIALEAKIEVLLEIKKKLYNE